MGILDRKKQKVRKAITDRYKMLREELDKFEKEDFQNLDKVIQKT